MKCELICVSLNNGDCALFLNGDAVYQLDAQDHGQNPAEIGEALAKALDVTLTNIAMDVPSDEDWCWNDVYELLPPQEAESEPALMPDPADDDGSDYILCESARGCWITVRNTSVHVFITPDDESVVADIHPHGLEMEDPGIGESAAVRFEDAEEAIDAYEREINRTDGWLNSVCVGSEVFWNDPDAGISSGYYTVAHINTESGRVDHEDAVLMLKNAAGSECEVFAFELGPVKQ